MPAGTGTIQTPVQVSDFTGWKAKTKNNIDDLARIVCLSSKCDNTTFEAAYYVTVDPELE